MILLLIALISAAIFTLTLHIIIENNNNGCWYYILLCGFNVICIIIIGTMLVCYCFLIFEWKAADYKAKLINERYKTNYTQTEVFYADDIIKYIHKPDSEQK